MLLMITVALVTLAADRWLPVAEGRRCPMGVLVTCGSTRGGTEGLAHMVAADLRDEGVNVDLLPPS